MAWNRTTEETTAKTSRKAASLAKWWPLAALAAATLAAVAVLTVKTGGDTKHVAAPAPTNRVARLRVRTIPTHTPADAVRQAMSSNVVENAVRRRKVRIGMLPPPKELYAHLAAADRRLADSLQRAMDANDYDSARASALLALESKTPEVRQGAVEALGWFGVESLPELTQCMADADEDVRDAAANQWEQAVHEVENPTDRFGIIAAAMSSLSDADQLTSLGGILSGAAMEMIDGTGDAELADENRLAVLQTLVDLIEGGGETRAEAAKEAYNEITGSDWAGLDEAERYLDDPENYTPPEDVDGDHSEE